MTTTVEAATPPDERTGGLTAPRFAVTLTGIVVLALAVRVAYVLAVTRYLNDRFYDAFYYIGQSVVLADGGGFQTPVVGGANALHPPLTALVVTPASWLVGVGNGAVPQRITMAVIGALAVAAIGWLGMVVAGRRVGLIAAVVAAVYPNLVMPSGIVMSESLAALFTALVVVFAYRLVRHPTWAHAALLGLGCGAAALTRSELLVYVVILLAPAVLVARAVPMRTRLALLGVGIAVAGLTVAPWVVRNLATFHDPTFLSTGDGGLLLGANCDATYHGDLLGAWSLPCSLGVQHSSDPSVESARQDRQAITYMRHHLGRLPVVVAARVGRVWEVFRPFQTARVDEGEGRPVEASWAGLAMFYVLVPLGLVGIVVLGRRRVPRWPLVVPFVLVTALAAVAYGIPRFRVPAEVSLVVLAAVAVDAAWQRWAPRAHPVDGEHPATG